MSIVSKSQLPTWVRKNLHKPFACQIYNISIIKYLIACCFLYYFKVVSSSYANNTDPSLIYISPSFRCEFHIKIYWFQINFQCCWILINFCVFKFYCLEICFYACIFGYVRASNLCYGYEIVHSKCVFLRKQYFTNKVSYFPDNKFVKVRYTI